jgi:hypothetical protein
VAVHVFTLQCFPCDKGYYTSKTTGNLLCSSCPPGSSTAGAGSILADGAAVQSLCIGLPSAAQVQAVLTTSRATAAYSLASCTALLAEYGGVFEEVGNGLCNPGVHNTAVCNYDGGDCCRSTCVRNVSCGWSKLPCALLSSLIKGSCGAPC